MINNTPSIDTNEKIVHHHVKYKEIHGVDEIKLMTQGDHLRLHNRLRREGKCNIPVKELGKITKSAYIRMQNQTKYIQRIDLHTNVGKTVRLTETIMYNRITQHLTFISRFQATSGHKLYKLAQEREVME